MIKTYKFSSQYTNNIKIDKIKKLSYEYKKYYNTLLNKTIYDFYKDKKIPKYLPQIEGFTLLSARYKQTCGKQVKSNIDSWLSNIASDCNKIVYKYYKKPEERLSFYYINKYHLWFNNDIYCDKGKIKIPIEIIKISRKIFKHCMGKIPKMHNIAMVLDSKVANVEKSNNSFDYWIKLSTLNKNGVIYLPIKSYDYYNKVRGKDKKSIQIIIKPNLVEYGFIKDVNIDKYEGFSEISIDHGLNCLLSSSSGSQYGKKFITLLRKYDNIINHIVQDRMRKGLYKTCPKLQRLYAKVSNLVKNETGRSINRLIKLEQPKVVVMEDTTDINETVKSFGVARRLLSRSGFAKIPKRMESKCKDKNVKFILVNSAYNSQRCEKCGYVHSDNRHGSKFKCLNCGYKINADYNASRNISVRRSNTAIDIYTPYRKVKDILEREFLLKKAVYSAACGS
jgi:putative transposase